MDRCKYLIIGASISGLSFVNFLDDEDYLILEAEDSAGGYCKTIKQDGFVWDYSGHFFHFRNNEIKDYIFSRIDQTSIVKVNKNTKIHYKDSYIDFPFQKNIHQLPKDEFIDCLYDLYFSDKKEEYFNFLEMLYGNFGESIVEKFLLPYNEKLYACPLNTLDVDAMGRFFPQARVDEVIRNFKQQENSSYNSHFLYSKNGAIEFVNALLKGVNAGKISFNEKLLRIDAENKIAHTSKRQIKYSVLINSSPFNKLLDMMGLKKESRKLSSNKVVVFNLGFSKKGQEDIHWIYFPEKYLSFYRVGFYDNILSQDRMSLYVEIGYSSSEDVDLDRLFEKVLADLQKVGIVQDNECISHSVVLMDPAYVHISDESEKVFKDVTDKLKTGEVYSIGRYGGWKYCSIEDCIIDARDLAIKCNV